MRKIRLFVEEKKLQEGLQIKVCDGSFEYLAKVMRQKIGDRIFIFNGVDGEFLTEIIAVEKKSLLLEVREKISALKKPSYLRLGLEQKLEGVDKTYSPWRKILDGDKGLLLVCGALGGNLVKDFLQEEKTARPAIWLLSELSSNLELPKSFCAEIVNKKICVVEEHVLQGGIGQMIATKILEKNIAIKSFSHLHAQGYVSGFYGSQNFHRAESNLTKAAILKSL